MSEDDSGFKQDYVNVSASTMIAWQEIIDLVASISNARAGLILNALKSEEWKHNPDLKHNMISYLGFPIQNVDGSPFGTICLLDDKENPFSGDLIELTSKMRDLIEGHLRNEIVLRQNAEQMNEIIDGKL